MECYAIMTPDIFNQAAIDSREIGIWIPILGMIIVFLGMNMSIEIKIQKDEEEDD